MNSTTNNNHRFLQHQKLIKQGKGTYVDTFTHNIGVYSDIHLTKKEKLYFPISYQYSFLSKGRRACVPFPGCPAARRLCAIVCVGVHHSLKPCLSDLRALPSSSERER